MSSSLLVAQKHDIFCSKEEVRMIFLMVRGTIILKNKDMKSIEERESRIETLK